MRGAALFSSAAFSSATNWLPAGFRGADAQRDKDVVSAGVAVTRGQHRDAFGQVRRGIGVREAAEQFVPVGREEVSRQYPCQLAAQLDVTAFRTRVAAGRSPRRRDRVLDRLGLTPFLAVRALR